MGAKTNKAKEKSLEKLKADAVASRRELLRKDSLQY